MENPMRMNRGYLSSAKGMDLKYELFVCRFFDKIF